MPAQTFVSVEDAGILWSQPIFSRLFFILVHSGGGKFELVTLSKLSLCLCWPEKTRRWSPGTVVTEVFGDCSGNL